MTNEKNTEERTGAQSRVPNITSSRLAILLGFHKIAPVNEAVIVVNRFGKKEYSSRKEDIIEVSPPQIDKSTKMVIKPGEYRRVPRRQNPEYPSYGKYTRIERIPLENLRVEVGSIKLNDSKMAEFQCDVVCFVHINDPMLAAERTNISKGKVKYEDRNRPGTVSESQLAADFRAILEAVCRTTATQQTILEIYKDRQKLQQSIAKQVEEVFPLWGLELTDLEIQNIKDVPNSSIIHDIERKIEAEIKADAEVKVAEEDRRARVVKAEQNREAELAEYAAQETAGKREIEKDQVLGIAEQLKSKEIQVKTLEANQQLIEAKRKLDVGNADINKQVTVTNAEAQKQKTILNAEAENRQTILSAEAVKAQTILRAEATKQQLELEGAGEGAKAKAIGEGEGAKARTIGEGEAAAIKAKKVADAEGTERLAVAQKQYGEAQGPQALEAKRLDMMRDVLMSYASAGGKIAENAHISVISGDSHELMNGGLLFGKLGFGPKEGAAMAQFAQAMGLDEKDVEKLIASMVGRGVSGLLREGAQQTETTPEGKKTLPKSTVTG
ncbi:MAG: hypothetical protein LVQ95_04115 [Candidatus Micrarchaeales archaeon]|nr:hypothetical protein [Candidatus Micrarchaeales archaeon]